MDSRLPKLIPLSSFSHESGVITVAEKGSHSDFGFERVYFIHGLGPESERGSHAHRSLSQLMIAASGHFRVRLQGPNWQRVFNLDDPNFALYIPPLTWRDLDGFSDGAICLVLASHVYDESDYIRDYSEFTSLGSPTGGDSD